ncbi:MAG: PKD domain-containing protein [Bacteroidota bacterium]
MMYKQLLPYIFSSAFFILTFFGTVNLQAQCIDNFPYKENFDAGAGGWTPGPAPTDWSLGTPAKVIINSASSAPNSWITGTLFSSYPNNADIYIESPCFDFTNVQNPAISMNVWWESEFGADGTVLVSSVDGGATWQRVGNFLDPVNWYNDNNVSGSFLGGPPCNSFIGWGGRFLTGNGSQRYVLAQRFLTGLAGQPDVRFRLCFASDLTLNADGFAFDDVIIADVPIIELGPDQSVCFGDTVQLDACDPRALDYQWNTSPIDTLCELTALASFEYIVQVTDTNGFIIRDTMSLFVSPTDVVLPPDQLLCPGDTLELDAGNAGANHQWLPGGQTTQRINVTETGNYKVTVSDNFGCVKEDSIEVLIDFVPDVDLGNDTTICIGETLLLDAGASNPGTVYNWNFNGATTQTIFVSAPQEYVVVVTTAANCVATDSIDLGVSLTPVVDLGPDRNECGTFTLDSQNPGSTYLWSSGETTQSINKSGSGTFWVRVTNADGCFDADTVTIGQGTIPPVDLGDDPLICNGSTATLDLQLQGFDYFWSTGETTRSITVSTPGVVVGRVRNADGCESIDSVTVIQSPLIVELGPDLLICNGDSTQLNAGNTGVSYLWNTGEMTQLIFPQTGGLYIVEVTGPLGCVATDSITLQAQANFSADFASPDSAELFENIQFTDESLGNPTNWFWEFGDGLTSTDQNPVHAYQSINTFEVCLTVREGVCENVVCKEIVVEIFTGIEEELGLELDIYPNPNRGRFNLDISLAQFHELSFKLLDISGKAVYQKELGVSSFLQEEVYVPGLNAGIYLLELKVDEARIYRKVLIQ